MKFTLVLVATAIFGASAVCPNSCSGHGSCNSHDECECFTEGKSVYFGYLYDTAKGYNRIDSNQNSDSLTTEEATRVYNKNAFSQAQWTGADCSLKTCSRGVSWTKAHASDVCLHADFAECSDQGLCDRTTGECICNPGYEGAACQRTTCHNECSGHGVCQSNVDFSVDASVDDTNLGTANAQYGLDKRYLGAWDSGLHYGCKCDLGYRGSDCSMKECPSSADPLGWHGNSEGEDCSGRGLCDFTTGQCQCFSGYTGTDCGTVEALA